MSNMPDKEYMHKSIVPKSDQLNADSLLSGPITVTITGVRRGDSEQPIIIDIDGEHQPWKPGKSMRRVLIAALSDDPIHWVGQRVTLFCDPEVRWANVKVGGIRIAAMSGIKSDMTFMLTQTRGKKSGFHVKRIATEPSARKLTDEEAAYVAECTSEIDDAESLESLSIIAEILKGKSQAVKDALKPVYRVRKAALELE